MADHTTEPHTAEPWAGMMASNETVIYGDYHDGSGTPVAKLTGISKPDFTRMIRCVNACADLVNPEAVRLLLMTCQDALHWLDTYCASDEGEENRAAGDICGALAYAVAKATMPQV